MYDDFLNDALADCERRGLSAHTVASYRREWRHFLSWCFDLKETSPEKINESTAREYLATACESKAANTSAQIQSAISYLYRLRSWPNPFAKIPRPKVGIDRTKINYLPILDVALLLGHLEKARSYEGQLCSTIAAALYYTASRYQALANIELGDIVRQGGRIVGLRVKLKGGDYDSLGVIPALSELLEKWLVRLQDEKNLKNLSAQYGMAFCRSPFVFAGCMGKPYTIQAFNLRLKNACKELRLTPISSHGWRHSAATALLNNGQNLKIVQEILNHADIRTTARYLHLMPEAKGRALESLSIKHE